MPRLTRDEAFRLQDRFEEFIHALVGTSVTVKHTLDAFIVERVVPRPRIQADIDELRPDDE